MLGEMTFDERARSVARINNPTAAITRARKCESAKENGKPAERKTNTGHEFPLGQESEAREKQQGERDKVYYALQSQSRLSNAVRIKCRDAIRYVRVRRVANAIASYKRAIKEVRNN